MLSTMTLETINSLIEYNKTLKAGVILWSNDMQGIVGFSIDSLLYPTLKICNKPYMPPVSIPNFAVQTKDLVYMKNVLEEAEQNEVTTTVNTMHYPNTYIEEMYYGNIIKPCPNFLEMYSVYINFMKNWMQSEYVDSIDDLRCKKEWDPFFTSKASEGIKTIHCNDIVYFVATRVFNILKADSCSLEIRRDPYSLLVRVRVLKSKGVIEDIFYRMLDVTQNTTPKTLM